MQIIKLYSMVLKKIQAFTAVFLNDEKSKVGRKPKLTDEEIASIFILSFITGMPAMKIANQILNPSIRSYHIFRKSRAKRVYNILRKYIQLRLIFIILVNLVSKNKIKTYYRQYTMLPAANVNRARTQKIKRFK
ncbi:MAG: hypothetical protein ACP5UF_02395, partial [Hydrogenobaculum sp.]